MSVNGERKVRFQSDHGLREKYARVVYKGYALDGHSSQSFERLHERGGFGIEEMIYWAYMAGRGEKVRDLDAIIEALQKDAEKKS